MTPTERACVDLFVAGWTIPDIAAVLNRSEKVCWTWIRCAMRDR